MKCHRCQSGVRHWRTHCPECGTQMLALPYSTISEAAPEVPPHARRLRALKVLRLTLLVIAVAGLAVAAKWTSAVGNSQTPNTTAGRDQHPVEAPALSHLPAESAEVPAATPVASLAPMTTPAPRSLNAGRQEATSRPAVAAPPSASVSVLPAPSPDRQALAMPTAALPPSTPPTAVNLADRVTPTPRLTPSVEGEGRAGLEVEASDVVLTPRTALLTIKSYVPARIYIDGAFSGVTPRAVKLLAGEHTVTLVADGYQEWTRKVRLSGQQLSGMLVSLKKPDANQ